MKFNNLKEVTKYFSELNKGNYYLDYILEEGTVSLEWYEAILEKVKEYKPKRVIDIGSGVNMFGYLFANEGIEYIGIDEDITMKPIIADNIKFINANYYNVREQFTNIARSYKPIMEALYSSLDHFFFGESLTI